MGTFFTDVIQSDPRFTSTRRINDIQLLEPATRAAVLAIIAEAAALGIKLMAFETFRSVQRQQQLFDQGASKLRQVGVHHYGLACDLVKDIGGDPSWKGDFTFLRALAKNQNVIWGGDWGTPNLHHSFVDSDHIQRCSVGRQPGLFLGTFYPDLEYNPYES